MFFGMLNLNALLPSALEQLKGTLHRCLALAVSGRYSFLEQLEFSAITTNKNNQKKHTPSHTIKHKATV